MSQAKYYIGLMSGTSADGIDLALVDFSSGKPKLNGAFYQPYTDEVRAKIIELYTPSTNEIDRAFALDVELAKCFASAVNGFLAEQELASQDIIAIGSHGQTIRHRPNLTNAFTLQIGCNHTLATLTNIRVIGQFRHKDIALGGQGAPLVPAFHQAMFAQADQDVFVVNIGGIANITYLPQKAQTNILGFDTGPGNALLDEWYAQHHTGYYDKDGLWSDSGSVSDSLLSNMLADSYFLQAAPKSTGREYFNLAWLNQLIEGTSQTKDLSPCDTQATLVALTACSIAKAISELSAQGQVYLCGGGIHNKNLYNLLCQELPQHAIELTSAKYVDPDALEAIAFAWLANCFDKKIAGNIPAVTGASKACVLGCEFLP